MSGNIVPLQRWFCLDPEGDDGGLGVVEVGHFGEDDFWDADEAAPQRSIWIIDEADLRRLIATAVKALGDRVHVNTDSPSIITYSAPNYIEVVVHEDWQHT